MTPDPEAAELLARVAAAVTALRRTVVEAGLDPGIAATACAELAGENAAILAVLRDLPPGPLLDEVARVMRRSGAAAHHVLRPEGTPAVGAWSSC